MIREEDILVSVIVPVYNVEKYLTQCIDSFIAQTYKNIEIILVDDGSTDRSGEICDEFKQKDSRIIVIHKENGGISSARNKALDIAKGEYICFVDSDDFVHPRYVEILLGAALDNDCRIAQCSFIHFISDKRLGEKSEEAPGRVSVRKGTEVCGAIYAPGGVISTVVWTKIYHKSIWKKRRFPSGKIHEDLFVTFEILYECERVAIIDQKLYYYRKTPDSVTNMALDMRRLQYFEAMDRHLSFYKSKGDMEMYRRCMADYQNIVLLYTHLVYVKNKHNRKEILRALYGVMQNSIAVCRKFDIPVDFKYKLYMVSPFVVANGYEIKKRIAARFHEKKPDPMNIDMEGKRNV